MISLEVNGKKYEVEASSDVPLLWVIREHLVREKGGPPKAIISKLF